MSSRVVYCSGPTEGGDAPLRIGAVLKWGPTRATANVREALPPPATDNAAHTLFAIELLKPPALGTSHSAELLASTFRVVGQWSHRAVALLASATEKDLPMLTVYELLEVDLRTFSGILQALSAEETAQCLQVVSLLDSAMTSGLNGGQFSDTVSEAGTQLSLLHYAVKYGSLEVVSVLLAAGHRTDLRDKAGNRPVDWCFRAAIANLLDPSLDVQEVVPMVQRLEPRGDRALKVYSIHGRSSVTVCSGRYYFEAVFLRGDAVAVGWCQPQWAPPSGEGCGDDATSWGYACHGAALHAAGGGAPGWPSTKWTIGDVIGCWADIAPDRAELRWSLNGTPQGDGATFVLPGLSTGLCACATLFRSGDLEVIFDEKRLRALPPGYSALPFQ
mmetsp:Transcript_49212/g.80942  ORF Transcript_49212/g.80942 Transcript_49212/m.80942 type:complete len:388 (+) Transcript_49212:1-1164(+)